MRQSTRWFYVIGVLFLLWNMMGCGFYIMDVTATDAQYADAYSAEMAAVRHLYPVWAMAAYAIAVWGGLLAALLLLLRRRLSVTLFTVSLVASALCFIPNFVVSDLREAGGELFWLMPAIVIVIALVQVWFSGRARAQGFLR